MTAKAALEAQLRTTPSDLATLAIYADLLMSEGDPRGEQIAFELQQPARHALLARWVAATLGPPGPDLYAFDERSIPFLDSPAGDFCRGVSALARMEKAREIVAAIARRPRPFLTRFKLHAGFEGPLVLDARHVAAMPSITELELDGDLDLSAFRHPRVKTLARKSWSCNGLASWVRPLDLPACEELVVEALPWSKRVDPAKVTFVGLPALRVLDVSACERQHVAKTQYEHTNLDVHRWVAGLRWLPQLTRLRLPSVRTRDDVASLRVILARAPGLETEVVRTYARCAAGLELASDRLRFAAPWPWLPEDQVHDHWKFVLSAPGGVAVDMLSGAIGDGLKRVFDQRDDAFREDWRTIWRALDACVKKPQQVSYGLLHRGFAGFPTEDIGSATSLRTAILALADRIAPDQPVTLAPGK